VVHATQEEEEETSFLDIWFPIRPVSEETDKETKKKTLFAYSFCMLLLLQNLLHCS